jgi:anaerobic selenocysteine-containing dehydrogenase
MAMSLSSGEPTHASSTDRFNCQLCSSLCGMVALVEDGRIVKVAGDRDDPISRGYTCAKGRAIPERHHAATRLDRPRLHGQEVSWETLLDDLAERLQRLVADGGPERVARYMGTGMTYDIGQFQVRRFMRGIGSKQIYSPFTLDSAPAIRATELVTGFVDTHPVWTPDESAPTLAILVGLNPNVSGGGLGLWGSNWPARLRDFRRRGGELWVIDSRATRTARVANRHLAPRPGTDLFLFGWLVRELLEEGYDAQEVEAACDPADVERLRAVVAPFELDVVAARTSVAASDLLDLLAAVRRHRTVAIKGGTGISFTPNGVVTWWLIWATMILTGSLDREGGLRFYPPTRQALNAPPRQGHAPEEGSFTPGAPSRPELPGFFGERPAVALVDEIEAGNVRALLVFGGNFFAAAPEPDRMRAALAKLEVLAVFDAFDVPLTQMASHAIPCTWITERSAFFHSPSFLGFTRSRYSAPLVPPGAERRHAWWVLAQLGRRLGIDVLKGLDLDVADEEAVMLEGANATCDFVDEVIASGTWGVEVPHRYGWYHENVLPGGRWRLAPPVVAERLASVWNDDAEGMRLVSGRVIENVNSVRYAKPGDDAPPIHVSADAAAARGIASGDRVRVSTAFGAVEGPARIDATLACQSVWISHGWLDQNVNRLTDPMPDLLTGQPHFSGVPVQLERV